MAKQTAKKTTKKTTRKSPAYSLVIVESPTKTRTLSRILGKSYKIMASVGHVSDLPKSDLGVDVENDFEPTYATIRGKGKILTDLRKAAKDATHVYLAPDPDREGEAIAWHIAQAIKAPDEQISRITFDEITARGVEAAFASPRKIDMSLFASQQARRILDRLVGYKISPILWSKVRRGLSAGRVQSVAVRLVCDREALIRAFIPVEYWSIDAEVEGPTPPPFAMKLDKIRGEKAVINNEEEATAALDAINGGPLNVDSVARKTVRRKPAPPFITSTMQQEAARKLRYTARRAMGVAQGLYEGADIGGGEQVGLITYMRTDSARVADEALEMARNHIGENYAPEYLPAKPIIYKTKKSAQDAHEAIRPTDVSRTPESLKGKIDDDQWKLYELIWKRFVASQMEQAIFEQTRVEATPANKDYLLVATGQVQKFNGFLALYEEGVDDNGKNENGKGRLPEINEGDSLKLRSIASNQHFTQPPPRFTEATLVRELERLGIGRPSTYAATIGVIQDKDYVEKNNSRFQPTELGDIVNGLLVESFPKILDAGFTAEMEDKLDHVEDGSVEWHGLLRDFYTDFEPTLAAAAENMRNVKAETTPTDLDCDLCGEKMSIRWGRNGKFLSCSAYPECKNAKPLAYDGAGKPMFEPTVELDQFCPNDGCGARLVVKNGRRGRFAACPKYPECKHAEPIGSGVKCPNEGCDGALVEKYSTKKKSIFYSCNAYPDCRYAVNDRPMPDTKCERCGHPFLVEDAKADTPTLKCPAKGCGFTTARG